MARGKQLPQKPPSRAAFYSDKLLFGSWPRYFSTTLAQDSRVKVFRRNQHTQNKKKPNKKTTGNGAGTVECLACIFAVPGILSVLCRLEEFSWPTRRMCDILVNLPCAEVQVVSCGEYRSVRRFITSICSRVSCTASRCWASQGT